MNIVVVIQARTGSSRLPNKVLLPLAGRPLLQRMVERVRAASRPSEIVIATTSLAADEPVRDLARSIGVRCFSGHPTDLLDRHYRAGLEYQADAVVKIPSDCPLIDPTVIDRVIEHYQTRADRLDYVSNLHPASYPDGHDVEVIGIDALETAHREARQPFEREHTTPYLWERHERFRLANVLWGSGLDLSMSHRWTIDYRDDYLFLVAVYNALHSENDPVFGISKVLALLNERPDIAAINSYLSGVNWYRNHLAELRTIDASMTRTAMRNPSTLLY
ncbi:MAG: glycosyltransferase family protein [Candidatus Kapaibacterium sp.]